MSRRFIALFFGLVIFSPAPLIAYPDGAPWGSADPDADTTCSSCHFDGASIPASKAVTLAGMGQGVKAGESYALVLLFEAEGHSKAGFLLMASAGIFSNPREWPIEINGSEVRSILPQDVTDGRAIWDVEWTAPADLADDAVVIFHIAVNAANDDASVFGDLIHLNTILVRAHEK